MRKKKILFIVNPVSGVGKHNTLQKLVEAFLDANLFDYEIAYTERAGHATILATEAVKNKYDVVAITGGDGSVNEVAQALLHSHTSLAIIPTGSGNGVARHFNIPVNIRKAIAVINCYNIKTIDTASINNLPFVMVAGCGFDAHIAAAFVNYGKRGFLSYAKLVLREFRLFKSQDYKISIDGKSFSKTAFMITVANCSQFGNNAVIAPLALADDQLLNITLLKQFPVFSAPSITLRLFNKTIHLSKYIETFQGKNITIEQMADFAQIDGESITTGKKMEIKINPLSLKVLVPEGS